MASRAVAVLVTASLLAGCASAGGVRAPAPFGPEDRRAIAEFVQRLPVGSQVRVERSTGRTTRGTLMSATADAIVVQPATRLPEAPVTIPTSEILRVTLDAGSGGLGRSIAIGAAIGAGATFGVLLLLAAIFAD